MTSPTEAPRTAAGRLLHARIFGLSDRMPDGAELDNLILAIEAQAAAPASPDVVEALRHTERLLTELLPAADNAALIHEQLTAERDHLRQVLPAAYAEGKPR